VIGGLLRPPASHVTDGLLRPTVALLLRHGASPAQVDAAGRKPRELLPPGRLPLLRDILERAERWRAQYWWRLACAQAGPEKAVPLAGPWPALREHEELVQAVAGFL